MEDGDGWKMEELIQIQHQEVDVGIYTNILHTHLYDGIDNR